LFYFHQEKPLEKPSEATTKQERVDAIIRGVNVRVGQVDVTRIECEGHVLPQNPVKAGSSLEIELKGRAQVRMSDVGSRDARASVKEWVQPRAR